MKKVLVVEDDSALRDVVEEIIEGEGYSVITARDGEEGLQRLADDRPALVISDVMMPRLNGWQLCQAVASTPSLQSIPVIMMTASPNIGGGVGCAYAALIAKPIDFDQFLGTITEIIGAP